MIFKKYHKIRQFKDVVRDIQFQANFKGLDENNEPIYEDTKKPTLTLKGTVKLHGTNAGVAYTPKDGIVAQKRGSLLNKEHLDSHFGFNTFVQVTCKEYFTELMEYIYDKYCINDDQIIIYGEWAGQGIQKGVAISELPKAFYIFDIKIYNTVSEEHMWIDPIDVDHIVKPDNVFFMYEFLTYEMDIDFNVPANFQNALVDITMKVEEECPVAKQRGVSGVGEGVVWSCHHKGQKYIFKVKGEKHSTSKVKKLASVDPEVLNSINEFVEYACTPNRIEQGIQETGATEKRHTPDLLRWVANDIISEENDVLIANGLEWKQVAKECSSRVRQYFFTIVDRI